MINQIPVITIDGPSGAGKSTLCKQIAEELNWFFLESGKIYRLLAKLALKNNISILEENIILLANNLDVLSIKNNIQLDSVNNVSTAKNFQMISEISSQLSTYSSVRKILLTKQRSFRCCPGLVAEGRDMGTVVFPDATIKFFLNASLSTRVYRRMLELQKHRCYVNFQKLFVQMKNRDERDKNRLISPLYKAKNAIELDSTDMNFSDTFKILMKYIIKKIKL